MKAHCPPAILSEVPDEIEAEFAAAGNAEFRDWFVNQYQPWSRKIHRRLSEGHEWCLRQAR